MTAALLTLLLAIPPTGMGSLRIVSQPGVSVIWEDVEVGQTDSHGILLIEQIPLGRFSVKLQKPGHVTVTRQVAIGPNETRLALELSEIPRVRQRQPRPEPPPAAPARAPKAKVPEAAAPQEKPAAPAASPPAAAAAAPDPVAPRLPDSAGREAPASPASRPPAPAVRPPAEAGGNLPPALVFALIAAVILAASVLLFQARRARGSVEYRVRRSGRSRHDVLPSDREAGEAPGGVNFIDHLKKREMDLEKIETEGGVVEVEVTEIRTIEEDS